MLEQIVLPDLLLPEKFKEGVVLMEIGIATKNLTLDNEIKEYAEKKLSKLAKFLSSISSIKLELAEEKSKSRVHQYAAQVTVNINGFLIRGEQKNDDIRKCIDSVVDVTGRLIDKYKSRFDISKGRVPESIRKPISDEKAGRDLDRKIKVVKQKRFNIKPMKVEQAIDQMEFIGHDFFIFVNDVDNSINIIYRRKDGEYGLLQPELG
jgi:putative sigma-54 modulation protein